MPLLRAGEFLAAVGQAITDVVTSAPKGNVLKRHTAVSTQRTNEGWLTLVRDMRTGCHCAIGSRHMILATGEPAARKAAAVGRGRREPSEPLRRPAVAVRGCGRPRRLRRGSHLSRHTWPCPRVAIVGGSTSAGDCPHLAQPHASSHVGPRGVAVLHRRPLRIYYPSVGASLADNYIEFGPEDICPAGGRVFRLAASAWIPESSSSGRAASVAVPLSLAYSCKGRVRTM